MRVLAVDTALAALSVAVGQDGACLAARSELRQRGHAEALLPLVGEVLAEAGWDYDRLSHILITVGPGTFAGLRVGMAFARGVKLATGCALIPISSLHAIAAGQDGTAPALVVTQPKRGAAGVQQFTYQDGRAVPVDDVALMETEALADRIDGFDGVLMGPGAAEMHQIAGAPPQVAVVAPEQPKAEDFLGLAMHLPVHEGDLAPLYLRPPDAKLPDRPMPVFTQ